MVGEHNKRSPFWWVRGDFKDCADDECDGVDVSEVEGEWNLTKCCQGERRNCLKARHES